MTSALHYQTAAQRHADASRLAGRDPRPRVAPPAPAADPRRLPRLAWRPLLGRA